MFMCPRPVFACALVLATMLMWSLPSFSQTNASSLIYKSSGLSLGGSQALYGNGYLGTFVRVMTPGPVTFTVKASGVSSGGIKPLMHLHVADCKAVWSVGASLDYSATFDLPVGIFAVRIEFSDARPQQSLFIDTLTISGGHGFILNADSDDNALAAADSYITNFRRGPATVKIVDANGNPLPAGTVVRVTLKRHAFNFGTCVPGSFGDLWWADPNPAPGSTTDKYQKFVDSHFTMITPEACGKWAYQEATRDVVIMDYVDQYLDYAEKHGLRARMHCLCWDNEMSEPAWVNDLENRALAGDVNAKNELRAEISERIQYYVTPRASRYVELDCINETVANPIFVNIYGLPGVADIYNETVAASGGRAKVYVNELNVLRDSSYAEWYRAHIQSIRDAGGTVQGIGCQTNLDSRYPTAARRFHRNLQNIDGFELPISTTEYRCTMGGDTVKQMNLAMRLMFGNDMTTSFVMWGFWRNAIYSPNNEILANADWSLSACGVEYERLVALWSTNETHTVDASGQISFKGFYGDYDVTINGSVYPMTLVKGTHDYLVYESPLVTDRFERPDSATLGKTEIPNPKLWVRGSTETAASISGGELLLGSTAQMGVGVGIGDYRPTDIDLKVDMTLPAVWPYWGGIAYRESQPGVSNDGYAVRLFGVGYGAQLRLPDGTVRGFGINPIIDWSVPQCVHLKVTGDRHELWVGSRKIIDYTSSQKMSSGYVSLVRSGGQAAFDNLVVAAGQLPAASGQSPADVKTKNDMALVDVAEAVVTRCFSGFFYVQDQNRASGIRVVSSRLVSPGDTMNISGIVGTVDGEKAIYAWSVDPISSSANVSPLALTNAALGGGALCLQDAVWGFTLSGGASGGASSTWSADDGLNNIGLFVRTWGWVTQIDPTGRCFYIDDGSGLNDGGSTGGTQNRGVRVEADGRAYTGKYVSVTGISSCYVESDGRPRRLLRVASPQDVRILR